MTDAYHYKAFGLHIRTPFACPPLIPAPAVSTPDILVEYGPVPAKLKNSAGSVECWQFNEEQFLFSNRFTRFLVSGGERVTFDPSACLDAFRMRFHMKNSCLGMLLQQRNILALHANVSKTPRGAIVIMGESGAGKSTLLDALIRNGCPMMSDDLAAIKIDGDERPVALPGFPQYKLCGQIAERFDRSGRELERIPWRKDKYFVIAPDGGFADRPETVRAFYYLDITDGSKVEVREVKGIERFLLIRDQAYGPDLASQRKALFARITEMSDRVPMYRISRPGEHWTADVLVDIVTGETA